MTFPNVVGVVAGPRLTIGAMSRNTKVGLAPDPRGGDHRWLQLSPRVPLTSVEDIDLNHRVTVQA